MTMTMRMRKWWSAGQAKRSIHRNTIDLLPLTQHLRVVAVKGAVLAALRDVGRMVEKGSLFWFRFFASSTSPPQSRVAHVETTTIINRNALREGTNTSSTKAAMPATRQALKEKTNTAKVNVPVYPDDRDTEGLVKDAKPKRGRPKKYKQNEDELVMAGGLGPMSDKSASQPAEAPLTTDELVENKTASAAAPKTNTRPARTTRKIVQSEASSKVLQGLKERMEATARGQRAKPLATAIPSDVVVTSSDPLSVKDNVRTSTTNAAEPSEPSLTPSPPPPGKLSAVKGTRTSIIPPASIMKTHNTPLVESSILALKNFKRRPRQPSMLQMVQQRTASARPSLVNATNIIVDDNAVEDSSLLDLDLDGEDEDEDDFAPEAEGTPLNAGKVVRSSVGRAKRRTLSQSKAQERQSSSSTQKKRKSDEADVSSGSLSALRAKRQKMVPDSLQDEYEATQPGQDELDEEIVIRSSTARADTPQPTLTSDVQVENSPSVSTPPSDPPPSRQDYLAKGGSFIVPSTEREDDEEADVRPSVERDEGDADDDVPNATMADPLSSSPLHNTFNNEQGEKDFMRPPATQISPEPVKRKSRAKSKPVKTATLQSMLPRRRRALKPRHRKSEFDFEESDEDSDAPLQTSHLDVDEDELGGRMRNQTKSVQYTGRKNASTKKSKSSKTTQTTTNKPAKASAATSKKQQKTYSRRLEESDKENEGSDFEDAEESTLPEVCLSMQEVVKSKELEAAKAKFADIDDWDMEFESMKLEMMNHTTGVLHRRDGHGSAADSYYGGYFVYL
ncbi:uncharacterized protein MYCFIDRAFT_208647 [Pseudocercospora fijiensis CIRAD86]|uniref:Uncharacterized protein n=1 Tax=Pseudocercospora fijiensis (strain CIRAD86) TaxID=383855 RepID=M3A307_PSEFD|nr:uncharacterized protein MYCFIDRAFT_208647 [Pseudocercospora fijiensis CIRAD86]EME79011.1 hypothetical protein MYCFIDRAFT_208647 [Pseudocercospora fijiensis CIRAD86]